MRVYVGASVKNMACIVKEFHNSAVMASVKLIAGYILQKEMAIKKLCSHGRAAATAIGDF